jgi:hypothetical protein
VHALASIFSGVDTTATRVLRDILELRSLGIKDLRSGKRHDEEAGEPVSWPGGMRHYRIAGVLARDPGHPINHVLGDGMVRVHSATGGAADLATVSASAGSDFRVFPGVHHMDLARHPDVYAQIALCCAGDAPDPESYEAPAPVAGPAAATPQAGPAPGGDPSAEGRRRLRGVQQLLHDGLERGVHAIESYHRDVAAGVFDTLGRIPPIAAPVGVVRGVYDATTGFVYGTLRAVNRGLAAQLYRQPQGTGPEDRA